MHILIQILQILGSISLFIFAIKFLSDHLQALSGSNFKRILNKITSNHLMTILSGTVFTTTLQSSSAASVFILSFINTGLIQLKKAFGLILGANIGTTLTLIVVYLGMKFDYLMIALPILFISFPFYISKKRVYRKLGGIFIALALLFISIHFLKFYLPNFSNQQFQDLILGLKSFGLLTQLIFIALGIFITLFVHFSTASITIAILLAEKGLPLELATMLILGANIGTTVTTHLVAAIGDQQAKIVAGFHTFFNVVCAIIFLFAADFLIDFIQKFTSTISITLITFDILSNLIGVLLFLPFIGKIADYCQNRFLSHPKEYNRKTNFIFFPYESNSDLYRMETNKKMLRLGGIARQIVHTLGRMITESDEDKMTIFRERIYQLEKEGDDLEIEIKAFINEISNLDLPNENSIELHQLITLSHHLESVGDIAIKMAIIHRKRRLTNSYFTPKMRDYLFILHQYLDHATTILTQNLNENELELSIREAKAIEKSINSTYRDADNNLLRTIEKENLNALSAIYYKELIQHYEQVADHIYRANKTIIKLNKQ